MKASVIKNMPVVSMADGTKIGNVDELLFDAAKLRLTALLLTAAGGKSMLPIEKVRNIGSDVITIEDATATQGVEGNALLDSLRGLKELSRLRAINGEGTWVGDVKEIELDPLNGQISGVVVHRGGVLGLGGTTTMVSAPAIRGIGPKVITVETAADAPSPPSPAADGQQPR